MVRIKSRTKLLRSTTVYMFIHSFLCIYAKSMLLMARAANLLSLHFLLAFKYLSLHCFFNDIQCWCWECLHHTSYCSLQLYPHSGAWFQMDPWRNASDQVPGKWLCRHHLERLFHPAMLVTIFWLHCSYSRESGQYSQPWPNTNCVRLCLIFNHHCLLQLVKRQWIKLSNWHGRFKTVYSKISDVQVIKM